MAKRGPKPKQEEEIVTETIGYRPHKGQTKIHNSINNGKEKYYTICTGRQFGKTLCMINQMLYWALNDAGTNTIYVAPTYLLARDVFDRLRTAVNSTEENTSNKLIKRTNSTNLVLEMINGSTIKCFSGERYENLRGLTRIHYAVLDEMAYNDPNLWDKILKPATNISGKKICFISTPFGKNHFYKLFMWGQDPDKPSYTSFYAPSIDNPWINKDEVEEMRQENELIYRQEYLGEFLDSSLTVFRHLKELTYSEPYISNVKEKGVKYYIGIDIAKEHDYSCAVCIDEHGKVVDIYRVRYAEYRFIIDRLCEFYQKWDPDYAFIEVNMNESIHEQMIDKGCRNLKAFRTTMQSKPVIVQDLTIRFEKKEIKIPDVQYLYNELDAFTFRYNQNTGRLHYSAPPGLHDDSVIALCLANHAWKIRNGSKKTISYSVIK